MTKKEEKNMQTTMFEKILIQNNMYEKNGLIFSRVKPLICLGNLVDILPKLLEKNKIERMVKK